MANKKYQETMREDIQQAAITIITEEGYEKLSIRKIAAVLDCSASNIYNYYTKKADIINEVIVQKRNSVIADMHQVLATAIHVSIEEQFQLLVKTFVESMLKTPETVKAVLQTGMNIFEDSERKTKADSGQLNMQQFLALGAQRGFFRTADHVTATLILTNLLGLVSFFAQSEISDENMINSLVYAQSEMLLKGIIKER